MVMPYRTSAASIFGVTPGVLTQSAFAVATTIVAHAVLVCSIKDFAKPFAFAQFAVGAVPSVFAGTEDSILVCGAFRIILATGFPRA